MTQLYGQAKIPNVEPANFRQQDPEFQELVLDLINIHVVSEDYGADCFERSILRGPTPEFKQRMSAPIDDVVIIVAHTAPTMRSRIAGGATAHPRRRPPKRLLERLVTKTVRWGMRRARGQRSGDRNPYVSSSMTVRRHFLAMAAI